MFLLQLKLIEFRRVGQSHIFRAKKIFSQKCCSPSGGNCKKNWVSYRSGPGFELSIFFNLDCIPLMHVGRCKNERCQRVRLEGTLVSGSLETLTSSQLQIRVINPRWKLNRTVTTMTRIWIPPCLVWTRPARPPPRKVRKGELFYEAE